MNYSGAQGLVDTIDDAMRQLADMMMEPAIAPFESIHPAFEKLEKAFEMKAAVDASFAWLADLHEAGHKVGSSSAVDYLVKSLGISRGEAVSRLKRGRTLYDPPAPPPPPPPPPSDAETEEGPGWTDGEKEETEAERKAAAEAAARKFDRERKAQEKARRQQASAEKRKIIEKALENLHPDADPGYHELLNTALEYAKFQSLDALRDWLQDRVREANAAVTGPTRHNIAFNKRYISMSKPDEHGGVKVSMYLPGDVAAVLDEAINPARTRVLDDTDLEISENMTWNQRKVQLFIGMCRNFLNTDNPNLKGVGSIVVSMTMEDLENMTPGDVFPTNTGHLVDPFGLVRLGEAKNDFFVLHANNGEPLHVDTGKRTASLYHRIALFASELVCSAEGCDRPMNECEAHHLIAHSRGGPTSGPNLSYLCWGHHRDNNDDRNPVSPFGWAERDPDSGRVGHRPKAGESIRFNDSPAAQRSGGAKIRRRYRQDASSDSDSEPEPDPDPDVGTAPGTDSSQDGLFDIPG